jgi:hypothetical protein
MYTTSFTELGSEGAQGVAQPALLAAEARGRDIALKSQGGESGVHSGLGGVTSADQRLLKGNDTGYRQVALSGGSLSISRT